MGLAFDIELLRSFAALSFIALFDMLDRGWFSSFKSTWFLSTKRPLNKSLETLDSDADLRSSACGRASGLDWGNGSRPISRAMTLGQGR